MRTLMQPPPGGAVLAAKKLRAPTRTVRRGGAPPPLRVHASQRPAPQSGLMRGMRLLAGALASAQAREATPLPPPAEEEAPPHRKERAPELRFRTVFISDIHLGTAGCQAGPLLAFLRDVSCERLYLVGDFVDGWELSERRVHWPQEHSDVIQKLLRLARKGTKVIYTPGNHDEALRDFIQDTSIQLGENITVQEEALHVTADGRRLLVLHGDRCDLIHHVRTDLNYRVKNIIYRLFQFSNRVIKRVRRLLRLPYWSLASTVNTSVAAAAQLIANYEAALANEARCQGVDGVVCGHIHHAALRDIDGVLYANTGDWVDSCTALVEHADGRLEVLRWLDMQPHLALAGSGSSAPREPKSAALDFLVY